MLQNTEPNLDVNFKTAAITNGSSSGIGRLTLDALRSQWREPTLSRNRSRIAEAACVGTKDLLSLPRGTRGVLVEHPLILPGSQENWQRRVALRSESSADHSVG